MANASLNDPALVAEPLAGQAHVVPEVRQIGAAEIPQLHPLQVVPDPLPFNPRFYHGMWFEVVRGMPLPAFTYFAGLGDDDALRRAIEQSRLAGQRLQRASAVQGSRFFSMLAAKGVSGAWPAGEVRKWTDWYRRRRGARYDLITSKDDYLPAVVDAVTMVSEYAMHPRSFVRTMIRNA